MRTRSSKTRPKKPRILTITQSTYDGIVYNVEMLKEMLDGRIDTLHFDEHGCRTLPFMIFTRICTRSAKIVRAPKSR